MRDFVGDDLRRCAGALAAFSAAPRVFEGFSAAFVEAFVEAFAFAGAFPGAFSAAAALSVDLAARPFWARVPDVRAVEDAEAAGRERRVAVVLPAAPIPASAVFADGFVVAAFAADEV
ncbi:MAG: hypothetical protein AAFW46_07020 [Pseudomonadota bacterium]